MATITRDIPYGSGFLQKADLYVPSGSPKGVILWIHGGGWGAGSKSAAGFSATLPNGITPEPALVDNDDASIIKAVDKYKYIVCNINYRLWSDGTTVGYGGSQDGFYPNNVNDVKTVLNYITVSGAGAGQSGTWQTIYNYVASYGLMVAGSSAGGHLAIMGVGEWGTSSGIWPSNGVASFVGPLDLDYYNAPNSGLISQAAKDMVNAYTQNAGALALQAASPRYKYGSNASPGTWHTAIKNSNLKFYFLYNTNDTLIPANALITPFINTLTSELGSERVSTTVVTQGDISIPNTHNIVSEGSALIGSLANEAFNVPSYGIQITGPNGNDTVNLEMAGGRSFVQEIIFPYTSPGEVRNYTFDNVPSGDDLVIYTAGIGPFYWTTGTSGGKATLTITAYTPSASRVGAFYNTLKLWIFAKKTTETFNNDYGIALINEVGERTVSALYPTAEFLGKVTFNSTASYFEHINGSTLNKYYHQTTANVGGAGRKRLILWNLPSNANDTWYTGDSYIVETAGNSFPIECAVINPDTSYAVPEAFIFAIDGLTTGSDTYGIRVYDSSGNVTFDGAKNHLVIKGFQTGLQYATTGLSIAGRPTYTGTANSYTLDSAVGVSNPLVFLSRLFIEQGVNNTPSSSLSCHIYWHEGVVRRQGNILYMKRITTYYNFEDYRLPSGYLYQEGMNSNLITMVVDGSIYGAFTIGTPTPLPTVTASISPDTIPADGVSTAIAYWSSTDATSVSYSINGGPVTALPSTSGSTGLGPFSPGSETTFSFTVTATGPGGTSAPTTTYLYVVPA